MQMIRIAGAGPAGLSAAITLAQAGYEVNVFERHPDVGGRFSGDLQGLENWSERTDVLTDLSAMGLKVNFECTPFSELTVTNGTLIEELKTKRPLFYLVKRGSMPGTLDQGLKQQALAVGVNINFSVALKPDKADIVATGPIMTKLFGLDAGLVFSTKLPDLAIGIALDDAGYKGYAYLLVTNGYGCLCTVLFDQLNRLESCLAAAKQICARLVDLDIVDGRKVGGVGSFVLDNVWERDQQKFVGEAAGLQDLLWGFGIRNALTSGWLAARGVITRTSFTKLAQHRFRQRNRAGVVNRYLWERLGQHDYRTVIRQLGHSANPFPLLRSFYNFNLLQRALYPFALRHTRQRYRHLVV